MTLNGVALLLSMFVMWPIMHDAYVYFEDEDVTFNDISSLSKHVDEGLDGYRDYLIKYSDRELVQFFENAQLKRQYGEDTETVKRDKDEIEKPSIFALLPAYALSEIKSAFKIGFYLYLPFVVVDLVVSSVLLALGMMMMSPVTISTPIKLVLFVALDGWTLLSKGLILQYMDIAT